jgi:hypothetical protein
MTSSKSSTELVLTWRIRAILVVVGLLVSAIALEVAFRVMAGGLKPTSWNDRPYGFFLPSDAHTLQESDSHPKAEGAFRIAIVGDSFTFGPNMQLADTFPKRLEQMLNLNQGAPRVEVLNRGLCGSSTAVEVEQVRRALLEQPNLLVLEITLNDAEPHPLSREEYEAEFKPAWLKWRIFSVWRSIGFVASRIHNYQSARRYIDYHSRFFKDPPTFEVFRSSLERIGKQAENAGVPLIAMVYPLFDYPVNERYPFHEVHEIIGGALAKAGIPAVDLREAYRNIPPDRLQVIPGVDNHPNEIAHRIAAEYLLSVLVRDALVPAEVVPRRVFRARKDLKSPSSKPDRVFKRAARVVIPNQAKGPESEALELSEESEGEGS